MLIKKIWKALPSCVQHLILGIFCYLTVPRPKPLKKMQNGQVYVVGSFSSVTGIGKGARLYLNELHRKNIPAIGIDATQIMLQKPILTIENDANIYDPDKSKDFTGIGTVVIHANPPLFFLVLHKLHKKFWDKKRIIAYWAWELESLPLLYKMAIPYAHEFEVPSEFVANAIRKETNKSVTVKPHVLPKPSRTKASFCEDGILRILYIFDMGSSCERKNPWAAIDAFQKAFPDGKNALLTLKVTQHSTNIIAFNKLQKLANETPNVKIITDPMNDDDLEKLYLSHDIYLSTHHSEGYGLTIHEAINYGLYVVATGWSGNMEFMKVGKHIFPVPYLLENIADADQFKLHTHAKWANIDVQACADILKKISLELQNGCSNSCSHI